MNIFNRYVLFLNSPASNDDITFKQKKEFLFKLFKHIIRYNVYSIPTIIYLRTKSVYTFYHNSRA